MWRKFLKRYVAPSDSCRPGQGCLAFTCPASASGGPARRGALETFPWDRHRDDYYQGGKVKSWANRPTQCGWGKKTTTVIAAKSWESAQLWHLLWNYVWVEGFTTELYFLRMWWLHVALQHSVTEPTPFPPERILLVDGFSNKWIINHGLFLTLTIETLFHLLRVDLEVNLKVRICFGTKYQIERQTISKYIYSVLQGLRVNHLSWFPYCYIARLWDIF